MNLKNAQHRLNGKYPMLPYMLFFSLIIGFQFGFAMDVGQDELNEQLAAAVRSYFDPNQQATVVDRVSDLLNRGANPNVGNRDGGIPLLNLLNTNFGIKRENRRVKRRLMELLIRAGTNPNWMINEIRGRANLNCMIIEKGNPLPIHTSLSLSCAVEDRAIFDLLIEHGADMHQRFQNNKTLLHSAARCWNLELCEFLLRNGFDVNAVDANGSTPLHSVCDQDFAGDGIWPQNTPDNIPAVIELLLDWGAQINLQNKREMTLRQKLLYNNREMTPLHLVVARNGSRASARPAVRVLLARGADLSLLCRWSDQDELKSALELAVRKHDQNFKRKYKENRRLCELMMTHQVLVNKGALTLLCSLRKMGSEGNEVAGTLYRYRGRLLTPYLQQLYRPLQELLQRSEASRLGSPNLSRQITIDLSNFECYQFHFPNSKFNIDFLDPVRIPETYQNLNRNIYRGLHQPKIIGLTESNPVLNNNNNNEPHREEPLAGVPPLAPNDFDSYDDYSDGDNNDLPLILTPHNFALLAGEAIRHDGALTANNLALRAEVIHVDCKISMWASKK